MLNSVSASAASGLAAAITRAENAANNLANADSRGALPEQTAPNGPADAREPFVPARVEQSSAADGGTQTSQRPASPPFVPVFDTTASFANESGLVAEPNVDPAEETIEQIEAQNAFGANAQTVETVQDLVRNLYDLPE